MQKLVRHFATKINWSDSAQQRALFDSLAKKYSITKFEDWYKVPGVIGKRARGIIDYHGNSLFKALTVIYPEKKWDYMQLGSRKRNN